jgi:hypothetical protein
MKGVNFLSRNIICPNTLKLLEVFPEISILMKIPSIFSNNDFFLTERNLWQKNCIIITKFREGRIKVTIMATGNKKRDVMRCQRCSGRMIFEKFYDVNNVFFGWHCVICGEILDPVILLHRLSQDADLKIPEEEEEVMHLVKKYLNSRSKELKGGQKGKDINFPVALKGKISMN